MAQGKRESKRISQVAYCNIICVARFRQFDEAGALGETLCPRRRGEVDGFEHLRKFVNMENPHREREDLITYLKELAHQACRGNPGYPAIFVRPASWEIEFFGDPTSEGEISL